MSGDGGKLLEKWSLAMTCRDVPGVDQARTLVPRATRVTARCRRRWAIAGALACAAAYRWVFTPWQRRWGATHDEAAARLPGDDLVAAPAVQTTRGITIAAAPEDVWPWVVQLGADRGGFYSYDWLENLFGLGIHSADRIVDEWQERRVGDLVYADANGHGWWYVMAVRPNDALVLEVANVKLGRPVERHEGIGWEFLWTFAVREGADGSTRLLVRERVGFGNRLAKALMAPVGVVSFVMTRKMLLGIRWRAESRRASRRIPLDGAGPAPAAG